MLYFALQWAVREIEIRNGCPLHSRMYTQPWPPQSQASCTSVTIDPGSDILGGDEHTHTANNSMAEEKKHMDL